MLSFFGGEDMSFFLVNPSDAPKKKKSKKRRKNPELLIVNPYKLKKGQKRRTNMAKRKRKKSRKRKNPLARRRRRNPDVVASVKSVVNADMAKAVVAAVVGGGAALTVGSALAGEKLGESNAAKAAVAVAGGVLGAVVLDQLSDRVPALSGLSKALPIQLTPITAVALGAVALGTWELARGPVEDAITKARGAVGLAEWDAEFGSWSDEWNRDNVLMPGGGAAQFAQGKPFSGLTAAIDPEDNEFGSYEPLGDIYNNQRLGSFESEFGAFEAETALARDQQVRDEMAYQKGLIGGKPAGLGGYGGAEGFGQDDPSSLYASSWLTPTF